MEKRHLVAAGPAAVLIAAAVAVFLVAGMMRPRRGPGPPAAIEERPEPAPPSVQIERQPELPVSPQAPSVALVEDIDEDTVAPEEQLQAAPLEEEPPAPRVDWKLVDERSFSGRRPQKSYEPYYVIRAGEPHVRTDREVVSWHHYSDEPAVEYRPGSELLLASSRVFDRWVELSDRTPHTVKWVVRFQAVGGSPAARVEPNGLVIGRAPDGEAFWLSPDEEHTVTIERVGKELAVSLDDQGLITKEIEEDDRTPLRITAEVRPAVLRATALYFGKGEKLSPPPPRPAADVAPQWEVVYSEDFSTAESVKAFTAEPPGCIFRWDGESKALEMGPRRDVGIEEEYVMLHSSLPGDVRVRFRARSMMKNQPPFFGILVSIKGRLRAEDGYFVEWNYWQVQIKKRNARMVGKKVGYGRRTSKGQWMSFMAQRVGATITMFTEGREVLEWTDPYPPKEPEHDLFAFYSWRVHMEFDDIVIERNALDPVRPRPDHPVFSRNYLDGFRDRPEPVDEEGRF